MADDRTPLHWAASEGNTAKLLELLQDTTEIDKPDGAGWTPLMIAVSAGKREIVDHLLDRGANVNHRNTNGSTCLHYAASKNRHDLCKLLLMKGIYPNAQDKYGATALHRAASKGIDPIVRLLVEWDSTITDVQDKQGNTPLHLACEEEHYEAIKMLLGVGTDHELLNNDEKQAIDLIKNVSLRFMVNKLIRREPGSGDEDKDDRS